MPPCVANETARLHASRMSTKPKKRAASIHLDPEVWDRVTQMAQQERRPISQLLRNLVADAVDGRCDRSPSDRAAA
jgi:macrodomain Ter protein organizer (MatP/YcbG family)